jgi:hypothetical protein
VLLDVRLGQKFDRGHAAGARSLPLYIPIQGWAPAAVIRRAGFAFFGIYGTELNREFGAQAEALIPKSERGAGVAVAAGSRAACLSGARRGKAAAGARSRCPQRRPSIRPPAAAAAPAPRQAARSS